MNCKSDKHVLPRGGSEITCYENRIFAFHTAIFALQYNVGKVKIFTDLFRQFFILLLNGGR